MKSINKLKINVLLLQKKNSKHNKNSLKSNLQTIFSESNSDTNRLSNSFAKTNEAFYNSEKMGHKNSKTTEDKLIVATNIQNLCQHNSKHKKQKLPKIKSQDELLNKIQTKILNEGPLFLTGEYNIKNTSNEMNLTNFKIKNVKKTKKIPYSFSQTLYLKKPNKLKKEFDLVELSQKFDEKKKNFERKTMSQKNKTILNKLYGNTTDYIEKMKLAKKRKFLSLAKYQENIVRAFNSNGKYSDNIEDLQWKFKNLLIDCESVLPYPKINIRNIINHFKNSEIEKSDRVLSLKEFLRKEKNPRDEFEKEEKLINELHLKKFNGYLNHIRKKDNTFKIFNLLPPYLKEILIRNRKGFSK